ncbi:glycoside hydrolase family protein [Acinetobacter sp.]|uniref:glycoside hydrolase family protein n=1 Tax=Acinetobacter sp. TaxID=472 RepID=UPI003890D98F
MSKTKLYVAGSSLLLALGVGGAQFIEGPSETQIQQIVKHEGFTSKPIIPTKGDVPTIGHGTTYYPDTGIKVKMSDPAIDRKQALEYLRMYVDKDAQRFNKTLVNIPISQAEYDLYIDFSYQYGIGNWSKSSMLRNLKKKDYVAACKSLLKYKYAGGYDCSTPGNKRCSGVWTRQLERFDKCMGANS